LPRVACVLRVCVPGMKNSGFSLVEALIATAIVSVLAVSVAPLLIVSAERADAARTMSTAALLAGTKLEELRAVPWDSALLAVSPANALATDTPGYVDYLDRAGEAGDGGSAGPPPDTAYIRRWSVAPLPAAPDRAIVLQVAVSSHPPRSSGAIPDVQLVAVRARRMP
jgi:prepilin-type N-terminal cleavage/methylation domain-containing protein